MSNKRITPTFLGPAPSQAPKKKSKLSKSVKRKQRLDVLLGSHGTAPTVPEAAFQANRNKGNRKFTSEQEVLQHYTQLEAQQVAAAKTTKKKALKPTKKYGTTPIPPPPHGKTGVRGHWRRNI